MNALIKKTTVRISYSQIKKATTILKTHMNWRNHFLFQKIQRVTRKKIQP